MTTILGGSEIAFAGVDEPAANFESKFSPAGAKPPESRQ